MISYIQPPQQKIIHQAATDLLSHLKANKIYFVSYDDRQRRALGGDELYSYDRALDTKRHYENIDAKANPELVRLVTELKAALKHRQFKAYKISDYTKPEVLLKKMSRDIISELEDLYICGEATEADVKQVYKNIGKEPAKKFKFTELKGEYKKLYSEISLAIKDKASEIKLSTIEHYKRVANKIDPDREATTPKEFISRAYKAKVKDMFVVRLCVAYIFDNDKFSDLVNENFNSEVAFAAFRILEHSNNADANDVKVHRVTIGAKGFELAITVNGRTLNARAIPVEGYQVRFHYRYIIT